MFALLRQVALITGGDSGIGRAVALAFAREGADVAISYLNEHEDAKETERWVKDAGRRCLLLPGDLAEEATCLSIVQQTVQTFGRLDLLINNAAYQGKSVKSVTELDRQRVEYTFKANIIAMFSIVRAALPHMAKGGAVINTGSVQAYDPSAEILDYATTKAAIVGFTKGLAAELVPKGIRVNCVAPGPVWTPLVMASFPAEKLKVSHPHTECLSRGSVLWLLTAVRWLLLLLPDFRQQLPDRPSCSAGRAGAGLRLPCQSGVALRQRGHPAGHRRRAHRITRHTAGNAEESHDETGTAQSLFIME